MADEQHVAGTDRRDPPLPLRHDLETSGPTAPPPEAGPAPPPFVELPVEQHGPMTAGKIAVTGQMSGPHVQRVQTVADAYEGPPTVASNSGLPFETGTELSARLRRRSVGNAALPSNSGLPFETSTESIATPPRKVSGAAAALSGEGGLAAEATIRPGPVTLVPTQYPDDPAARLVVHNHVYVDVRSVAFRESEAKLDELIHVLRQSNEIAGETRDQLIAEIKAGRELLTAPKPDRNLLDVLLVRPLMYLAEKANSAIAGALADEALHLLLRMFDTHIPL